MSAATMTRIGSTGVVVWDGDPVAQRGEWLAARSNGVGASDIAAVLGLSPWTSPFDLFYRKLTGDEEVEHDQMRWGRRLEAAVADEYADRHPEFGLTRAPLIAHRDRPWQMCTIDRLLYDGPPGDGADPVAVFEVKTHGTLDGWGEDGSDEVPVQYRCQVLQQLDCVGVDVGHLALLVNGRTYREYEITRDEGDLGILRAAGEDFWHRVTAARADPDRAGEYAPPLDAHPATTGRLKKLHNTVDEVEVDVDPDVALDYLAACAEAKAAEEDKAEAANRMLAALGDARWGYADVDGERVKVATRSVSHPRRLDAKALRADHADLVATYTRGPAEPQIRLLPALPRQPKQIKDAS